ncbi:MAG: winged helix-turn-helix transcriptional regulator [Candidatus Thermoplasmatota archaeon]|nr:winged helix-turn-helix transcriptional regulator [Candidatus Thermoplasmatota archaeon]
MPIEMDGDSLEGKIIKLLMEGRPLTLSDVADELKISESKIERVVKGLASRGIIEIEELPDKKYLRLLRSDIKFHGVNPSQEKAIKKKKRDKEEEEKGSEKSREMMYR